MPNYKNGCVYKIISKNSDKIYIGSTTQDLNQRLKEHISDSKRKDKRKVSLSHQIIELDNYEIILIERIECNNKKELQEKERFYIEKYRDICVNKYIPTKTKKEWLNENKQHMIEYRKNYYMNHKEEIKKWSEEYYKKHSEQKKQYAANYKNLHCNDINEKMKQKIKCECGASIAYNHIARHRKTKSHLLKLNPNQQD